MRCSACARVGVAAQNCEHCGTAHGVWALGIGVRPTNALGNGGIKTIAELLTHIVTAGDLSLFRMRESGEVTHATVMKQLLYFGFVEKRKQKVRVQKRVLAWRTITETSYGVIRKPLGEVQP